MPSELTEYGQKLLDDLPEQFKDKPRIAALNKALGRQLQEVRNFFEQLRNLRSLENAMGAQLDGIGDIVQLSRADALDYGAADMDDETYRDYLYYKIFRNTNTATYYDIMRSLQMFWKLPLYYSEDPDYPATIIIDTASLPPEVDIDKLMTAPVIKAAGVGVHINPTVDVNTSAAYTGTVVEMSYIYDIE